jgi:hypothetical protein
MNYYGSQVNSRLNSKGLPNIASRMLCRNMAKVLKKLNVKLQLNP